MTTYAYNTNNDSTVRLVTVINESIPYLPNDVHDCITITEEIDRAFRSAWAISGGQLTYNYDIIRSIIRTERNKSLSSLDIKALAASRAGNTSELETINTLAQQLRDLPEHPDFACDDLDKLKEMYTLSKLVGE